MPKIPSQSSEAKQDETLETLKPYQFHGLDISYRKGQKDATADCPFCGRENKLGINVENSKFACVVCGESGNQYTFIQKLHALSMQKTSETDLGSLAELKDLLMMDTLEEWGICKSVINDKWLCPGYNEKGVINQLYQYRYVDNRWAWLPTGGLAKDGNGCSLFGMGKYDSKKSITILCEGVWDGTALYEIFGMAKSTDQGYIPTGSIEESLLSDKNVLSFPAARVFKESWLPLFADKIVVLMAQNDHPRLNEKTGTTIPGASYSGMERIVKMLISSKTPPKEIRLLHWGPDGFNPAMKSGYDLRDELISTGKALASRIERLEGLEARISHLPSEWILGASGAISEGGGNPGEKSRLHSKTCTDYKTLITSWRKAMRWRQSMDDVLSIMLAVAASTVQVGDQLFLQVVASAGSGKTKFCDAMLVSKHCHALEHLTGFHSGWKSGDGEDCSLISRINRKTMITPEGDVVMSSPSFTQIMSEQRRIFDGTSGATFKNSKEDARYTGLRTPWIMAGTPAMMDADQSHLGDRFLKVVLDDPDDDERRDIIRRCGHAALGAVMQTSNGEASHQIDAKFAQAFQLTGGYVDYLRENVEVLLSQLSLEADSLVEYCSILGEFTADLRARPDPDALKKDSRSSKEMPTRLTHQYVRLACCLAVVLNKSSIDSEVLRRVKKVAMDTSRGICFEIIRLMRKYELAGADGMEVLTIHRHTSRTEEKCRVIMRFMRDIGLLRLSEPDPVNGLKQKPRWFLTDRIRDLWISVMEEGEE